MLPHLVLLTLASFTTVITGAAIRVSANARVAHIFPASDNMEPFRMALNMGGDDFPGCPDLNVAIAKSRRFCAAHTISAPVNALACRGAVCWTKRRLLHYNSQKLS